jgi:hypothetical protein
MGSQTVRREVMEFGDAVDVNMVWAAQGRGLEPLRHWFKKSYTFVRREGRVVIVRHLSGVFEGMDIRMPLHCVRSADGS